MERNIQIKSADFDESKPLQLLLEINQDSYNYALIDENSSLKTIGSSTSNLESADFLNLNLSNIKISYFSKSFSIVPSNFEQEISSFKNLMEINSERETFNTCALNSEALVVYTINIARQQALYDLFQNFALFPQINPLWQGSRDNGVYVNIRGSYAEVLITKNSALNFYNIFEFKSDNELQYFLILILQQKAIDGKKERVYISGDISEDFLTFQRLKTLIPLLSIRKPETNIKIDQEFNNADIQRYFSLLNLISCG
ncbi:hypothetical protein Pedsa_0218 [Pseudopedobacter saltans DSM 12145]|uniref:DUF3822 domain-containing protein n=1 Tax=Pseudopedobacter saltans (strain ATCC 51119 / DSM 12145 / JCM 21818 / CCUG 39354 / LMG 10337 / NBRC 100064 / NCIMB 13643) TaxID=762903 RepID=F0SED9_PSESL|nr:DUF3822 family protein [Pseudopedobacter saltans]ADY50804.1 hypothetical protein Pedsa_0218 [Pseudopedobacter saltans DSM 12145]